jgi:hypothetical protein
VFRNLVLENLTGDNDGGIGAIAFNSQITFTNILSRNNFKGFDLGEVNGGANNIEYILINNTATSNQYGMNLNGKGGVYSGTVNWYLINNIITTNAINGIYMYAGPWNAHIVHNTVYANNAGNAFSGGNIRSGNDNSERQIINAYLYNNAFIKPRTRQNYYTHFFDRDLDSDGYSLDSDFNSWVQNASENFAAWAGSEGAPDNTSYAYGANGPGQASGNWYSRYSGDTTPPTNGATGHFHCDANSVTNLPPFNAIDTLDFTLTEAFPGTDLSSKPWFHPLMYVDRAGRTRTSWDIGAYEFDTGGPNPSPPSPNRIKTSGRLPFSGHVKTK